MESNCLLLDTSFLLKVMRMFWNSTVIMVTQFCQHCKLLQPTLIRWITWYANSISINLLKEKAEKRKTGSRKLGPLRDLEAIDDFENWHIHLPDLATLGLSLCFLYGIGVCMYHEFDFHVSDQHWTPLAPANIWGSGHRIRFTTGCLVRRGGVCTPLVIFLWKEVVGSGICVLAM